jgi:hypothetical protein
MSSQDKAEPAVSFCLEIRRSEQKLEVQWAEQSQQSVASSYQLVELNLGNVRSSRKD